MQKGSHSLFGERANACTLLTEQGIPQEGVVRRAFEMETKRQNNPRSIENWYFVNRFYGIKRHLVPGNVLDVGSAEGLFSCGLALDGWQVTALDIHPQLIRYLKRKATLNHLTVQCVQADALSVPLPDRSYDNIILGEIIEHLAHPQAMLQEARRVLRPSGRLIITTPVYPFFAQRSFSQWEQMPEEAKNDAPEDKSPDLHVFEFTPEELKSLVSKMGFELVFFTFIDTRMWESRLRFFKERAPLPNAFYAFIDQMLILLNRQVGRQRLPKPLRVRHMLAAFDRGG